MEGLRHDSQLMIRNSHVTEIIEQRIAMVGQLKEAAEVNIKEWDHVDLVMLKGRQFQDIHYYNNNNKYYNCFIAL